MERAVAQRNAERALAMRTLGGGSTSSRGISIGHEWMSPSQLASVGVGFDMVLVLTLTLHPNPNPKVRPSPSPSPSPNPNPNQEMNMAGGELPRFGPRGADEGEGVPPTMQTSACLTTRPDWLRQVMCLPRAGGGVVLCIPHAVFDHLPHQAAQLRAKLCDVQTYSLEDG